MLLRWKDNIFNDLIKTNFQIYAKQSKERENGNRGCYIDLPQP